MYTHRALYGAVWTNCQTSARPFVGTSCPPSRNSTFDVSSAASSIYYRTTCQRAGKSPRSASSLLPTTRYLGMEGRYGGCCLAASHFKPGTEHGVQGPCWLISIRARVQEPRPYSDLHTCICTPVNFHTNQRHPIRKAVTSPIPCLALSSWACTSSWTKVPSL